MFAWTMINIRLNNVFGGTLIYIKYQLHSMLKVSASLVHTRLQSLTKVLDSLCHWFMRKVVPDLLVWFEGPRSLMAHYPAPGIQANRSSGLRSGEFDGHSSFVR
jgi:hypothetical protein